MCAISGLIGLYSDEKICRTMLKSMLHRGPDGEGIYRCNQCTLLHSRLSIIDPEGGAQPMKCSWEGKRYVIVYNGELYNTKEIRRELLRYGHIFEGHSDTEVVLHAFAQWKEAALTRLNGIFAFAVWCETDNKMFLARDRIGVKPLFYMEHKNGLIFASEIKTILKYPQVEAVIDTESVAQLLLLGPGRMPGSGVFKHMSELEPGCCGWYENGKFTWRRYWQLQDREHTDSLTETAARVRYLVTDAITRQMVSDVPIGTFLSGGLDSSLISAVCARKMAEKGEQLKTFSLDFKNNDKYFVAGKFQPNSDNSFIHKMCEQLGNQQHWTVLTPEEQVGALEDATAARDLPGMADVDFSLLVFCSEIRNHVKVALSGECADELFGGYPWFRDPQVRALNGFPWAQNTKQRASFLAPEFSQRIDAEAFVNDAYSATIAQTDVLPGTSAQERRMKEMTNLNFRWFMQTLLDRKDRMSMHSGLEVRVPYCDYRIAEYLYGIPWEFKEYGGYEKGLLRLAMQDYLPQEVLWRKKSPYPKTYDPRYMELVSDMLRQILNSPQEPIFQIVRKRALEELLQAEYSWPWYGQLMQVPQTIAYMLQINFWLKQYHVQVTQ